MVNIRIENPKLVIASWQDEVRLDRRKFPRFYVLRRNVRCLWGGQEDPSTASPTHA